MRTTREMAADLLRALVTVACCAGIGAMCAGWSPL